MKKSDLTKILVTHMTPPARMNAVSQKNTVGAKEGDIIFTFDKYPIPFSYNTVKAYTEEVLEELYKKSGLDKIPVHFARGVSDGAIAAFKYYYYQDEAGNVKDYEPSGFTFHLDKLEKYGFSSHQFKLVIIHEFGHYMRLMKYGVDITDTTEGHDPLWEKCVKELGGEPNRYHTPHRTRIFEVVSRPASGKTKVYSGSKASACTVSDAKTRVIKPSKSTKTLVVPKTRTIVSKKTKIKK